LMILVMIPAMVAHRMILAMAITTAIRRIIPVTSAVTNRVMPATRPASRIRRAIPVIHLEVAHRITPARPVVNHKITSVTKNPPYI